VRKDADAIGGANHWCVTFWSDCLAASRARR